MPPIDSGMTGMQWIRPAAAPADLHTSQQAGWGCQLPPISSTWPKLMQKEGYCTGAFGKWDMGRSGVGVVRLPSPLALFQDREGKDMDIQVCIS